MALGRIARLDRKGCSQRRRGVDLDVRVPSGDGAPLRRAARRRPGPRIVARATAGDETGDTSSVSGDAGVILN